MRIDASQGGVSGLFLTTISGSFRIRALGRPIKLDELDLLVISDQTSDCASADFWRVFLTLIKRKRACDGTNREDAR